jgi:hypothetical protein
MALYSAAVRTPAAGAGAAYCDLRTAAGNRARVKEIGVILATAVASSIGLIRPATVGTASTTTAGQPDDPADPAGSAVIGSAWSSAPTVGSIYLRRGMTAAVIGTGVVWSFWANDRGLLVPVSSSLLLWNFGAGAGAALDVWIVWDE